MARRGDLDRFYRLLNRLADIVGGKQRLANGDGYMDRPDRGVYFFFAADERQDSGDRDLGSQYPVVVEQGLLRHAVL